MLNNSWKLAVRITRSVSGNLIGIAHAQQARDSISNASISGRGCRPFFVGEPLSCKYYKNNLEPKVSV